ncbi:hypothetical protein ASPWEDRAFT_149277 [Aspergillus wentii DTO 134E9]|uniref:Major facilitator superfamily (MFS) profile domain-containing protein n=1 Tax=Aspergillus wentii DTO 134E9 TaxID=1073089 RepID=A0A1L9RV85_ASPWE|nr:uncharacterized protein ASPWEDRAFT_149277 [Aspergillus wentii DTO 134E9]KAI9928680.1 hypothetical protein MW887_001896 [Aspergillus wentii]OJJ38767.1 hypothetical protein ASPWEDRAFT_149277 [Aspergillus wentii DTO 134E9]
MDGLIVHSGTGTPGGYHDHIESAGPSSPYVECQIELQESQVRVNQQNESENEQSGLREFSLPPVDGGRDAWLCLAGAFVFEMMSWGFPYSFGVFQDYYTTNEPFSQDKSLVSMIGSCALGIMYLASPVSLFIIQRWPHLSRVSIVVGLAIVLIAIVSSSFATRVWQLLLTQGIVYPLGACMLYYPVLVFIDEWFVRRKGLAYGACWAGTGVAGVIFPNVAKLALSRFSFRVTMWAWAVIVFLLVSPFLPFVKPRVQVSATQTRKPQHISFTFLKSPSFLIFQLGNLLQGLGYFAPTLYLPTFSRQVAGESGFGTTVALTAMNAGMVVGFILVGFLIDRWHVADVIFLATIGTVICVVVLWGVSVSLPPLCVFAVLYGVFAGSASATWPGIVHNVKEKDQSAPVGLLLGSFTAIRGVGSIACGPISEAVINSKWPWSGRSFALAYGTNFGGLIVFTGVTASFGVVGFTARKLGLLH